MIVNDISITREATVPIHLNTSICPHLMVSMQFCRAFDIQMSENASMASIGLHQWMTFSEDSGMASPSETLQADLLTRTLSPTEESQELAENSSMPVDPESAYRYPDIDTWCVTVFLMCLISVFAIDRWVLSILHTLRDLPLTVYIKTQCNNKNQKVHTWPGNEKSG